MKRAGFLVCAFVVVSVPMLATQASPPGAAEKALRIAIIELPDPNADAGRRDSTKDLRSRLGQRLDKNVAQVVPDTSEADVTVLVTSREIVGGKTNTVYARLKYAEVVTELIGRDEGMWGPAATSLAKNISAWVTENARKIHHCISDVRNPGCSSPAVDREVNKATTAKNADQADVPARRNEAARAIQLADEGGQLLRAGKLNQAKASFQQAEQVAPGQKPAQDGLAEIKRREDDFRRLKAGAESDAANRNLAAASDKLEQARTAHPELFVAENLASRLTTFSQQLDAEKGVAEGKRLLEQAARLASQGKYAEADAGYAAALRANPKDQGAASAQKRSERFVALTREGSQLEKQRNLVVAQQRFVEARALDATRFEREGLTAVLDRLLKSSGQQQDDVVLRHGLLALFKEGDAAKSIAILEPKVSGQAGGPKTAALYAYLGVAYATRALSTPGVEDQARLRDKAIQQFRLARSAQPDYQLSSRLVSPRILALFNQASPDDSPAYLK
jgi:tetratricopeptide (TPR) repeat protein